MNYTYLLCIYIPLILALWLAVRTRRFAGYHTTSRRRRRRGEKPVMEEIIFKADGQGGPGVHH